MSAGPVAPRVRSEVLTRADALAVVPLALVVAPAGSGKTTLLAAWRRRLAEAGEIAAYLDLSPLHGDASVFASDLLEVARRARPEFGEETARARAEHAAANDPWRAIARSWLRDAAALAAPLALFLDNFHELPAGSEGARWLDELLRARHPKLVFVVSSRGSVPASAARLRTEGALIEVNAADLSLRANEVQQLLADSRRRRRRSRSRRACWPAPKAGRRACSSPPGGSRESIPSGAKRSSSSSVANQTCSASSPPRCCATNRPSCSR